jgi:hypothetical protein
VKFSLKNFTSKIFNFNKKKEKEKAICLLAPIFVNQKSKELKINMVWPYNNKSTNSESIMED